MSQVRRPRGRSDAVVPQALSSARIAACSRPLNPPLPAWPDARVWIIGASYGIGAAMARALLARGARVALSAPQADKLRDVAGDPAAARGAR